jgi:hypothetical protein
MSVAIAYTQQSGGSTLFTVGFELFVNDDFPSSYLETASFEFNSSGSAILSAPASHAKRIWAISSVLSIDDSRELDALYRAWSTDVKKGYNSVVAVIDSTFASVPIEADTVFSTAPTYSRFGPINRLVSFGLTEV